MIMQKIDEHVFKRPLIVNANGQSDAALGPAPPAGRRQDPNNYGGRRGAAGRGAASRGMVAVPRPAVWERGRHVPETGDRQNAF